jgi:hypothetical protein
MADSFLILNMGRIGKSLALILILLIAISSLSLLMVRPAYAQSIPPKPSVPEFTIQFVPISSSVTSTDPYTGKNVTHQYKSNNIQITIRNQPFSATVNGNASNLYYDIQIKGHFAQDWTDVYSYSDVSSGNLPVQSSTEYTVVLIPANYQSGDKVDIQVKAILGYQYSSWYSGPQHDVPFMVYYFVNQASGWSTTQTFTMPNTFLMENFTHIIAAVVVLALSFAVVALLLFRRHRKNTNNNQ